MIKLIQSLFFIMLGSIALAQNATESFSYQTVLFEISQPNSNKTSYLFGTHHAFGKSFFDSLNTANQSLKSCDILIKENLNIPGQMAEDIINRRSKLTKWSQYLGKEDLIFIEELFAKSPTDFQKMRPTEMYAFLSRYFKQYVCLAKSPSDSSLSLDDYIGQKAKQLNIELIGLETSEEQINLINSDVEGMPKKVHKRRLANIIDHIQSGNSNNCGETDWYAQMDIDFQFNIPCQNSLMLTNRNIKWMETIKEKLESNNCFIAVGLSHLMYECGLIMQLEKMGYNIRPMKVN